MSSQHVAYDFDRLIDRRHDTYSYSQKWSCDKALAKRLGVKEITDNHIALFTADMDLRCAQPIIDALHATVDHGIFGYSTLDGCDAYADAIRGWFARHDAWDVDCDLMSLSAGTVKALDVCVQAFTEPGDGVIIQRPVYPPFMHVVDDNERTILNNQLVRHTADDPEGDLYYSIDFDNLEELAARPEAKMLILCNPHNPVGRVWTVEELERMAHICMKHDVLIVADEIHGDLVCEGLAATNVFFSNAQDKSRFEEVRGFVEPNPFAISAVIAAYNEGDDWYEQVKTYIEANLDTVIAYFADHLPDVGVHRPEGTYILWFDFEARCRKLGIDGAELHRRIYDDAQVLLQDGNNFDPEGGEFFQRMCVPTPRAMLLDACERIARVLAE